LAARSARRRSRRHPPRRPYPPELGFPRRKTMYGLQEAQMGMGSSLLTRAEPEPTREQADNKGKEKKRCFSVPCSPLFLALPRRSHPHSRAAAPSSSPSSPPPHQHQHQWRRPRRCCTSSWSTETSASTTTTGSAMTLAPIPKSSTTSAPRTPTPPLSCPVNYPPALLAQTHNTCCFAYSLCRRQATRG
jgi:hypothetical protein